MLIEFSVSNFRSFKDLVTLSLEADPRLSERDKGVDERNVADTSHGKILRVAGVYGANASGKSNLIRALWTFRSLVLESASRGQAGDPVPGDPFRLDPESEAEPSEVEVVYSEGKRQVRYGAAFSCERISREWLFVREPESDEEVRWFERRFDPESGADVYERGGGWTSAPALEVATRKEALHISTASQLNHGQAQSVLGWFQRLRVINGLAHGGSLTTTLAALASPALERPVRDLVCSLDVGVDDLRLVEVEESTREEGARLVAALKSALGEEIPNVSLRLPSKRITTIRSGVTFELADESEGTARAIALAGPLVEALAEGQIVVIDEFDARLHTSLGKKLVELFQDPEVNRHNAQLIFASHDTNLLTRTLLRRDQLWFVEKSHRTSSSDLYSLAEIRFEDGKRVRNDASYEADYLQGRYGAIPFFGNLNALLGRALSGEEG